MDDDVNERPSLALVDTENHVGKTPIQTYLYLSPHFTYFTPQHVILERGVHKPSPAESLAPFHQDPTQRIIALRIADPPYILVLRMGPLLKLLNGREGTEIPWDQCKDLVVVPSLCHGFPVPRGIKVSGCRLFYVYPALEGYQMEVYDFSLQGRAKYLSKRTIEGLGKVSHLSSTGARIRLGEFYELQTCHENIISSNVSPIVFCFLLE